MGSMPRFAAAFSTSLLPEVSQSGRLCTLEGHSRTLSLVSLTENYHGSTIGVVLER